MERLDERLSRADAETLLGHCLEEGSVIPSRHFREELANEGLDLADALQVLRTGTIHDEPEFDSKRGNWKYKVEGHETGGKWLCIVFAFWTVKEAFLITVYSIEARRRR